MAHGAEELPASVVETHISTLFFSGDKVVKIHKPVAFDFVDFRDLDRRREDCDREVALNRRLSPDVYLGTAAISLDGVPVEYGVVMRRLAPATNLARMVEAGQPVADDLRRVAALLAEFHRGARRSAQIAAAATPDALWQRWQKTGEELAPFLGTLVDADRYREMTRLASRYLAGRRPLLESRLAGGHIVDGHGDLQASDIFCEPDGPRILDCLEFDDELRYGDWLADLAFLVADLERLGAPATAEQFLADYRRQCPDSPSSLLDFYVAARAQVRVVVECLQHPETGGEADRFLSLGLERLHRGAVRLILVGGPPGSGKSSLASWLGGHLDARTLSSDVVRDRDGPERGAKGRYSAGARRLVYRRMCDEAEGLLGLGHSVVLDATWADAADRAVAREVAKRAVADLHEIRCDCPPDLRAARLIGRPTGGFGTSEATPAVGIAIEAATDPWPSARGVDCSGSLDSAGRDALDQIVG